MKKYRHFRWTLHVDAEIWHDIIIERFAKHVSFEEVVFQYEKAPETGALHYQGYLRLKQPYTERSVAEFLKPAVVPHHPWVGYSDKPKYAREYAQKEDTRLAGPWSRGVGLLRDPRAGIRGGGAGAQGARTDLIEFKNDVKAGLSDADLWEKHTALMARYPKMPACIRVAFSCKRSWKPELHIFYGAPGTGKSRRAHELAPDAYRKVPGLWWDGYCGQPDIIMDDFYGTAHMDYAEFLKLVDYYDYTGQVKGGMVKVNPRRVFVTSNTHPAQWYNLERNYCAGAFFRRVTSILHFQLIGSDPVSLDPATFAE